MSRADDLRAALRRAEMSLGAAVEQYRIALMSCAECGRLFNLGDVVIAMADETGRLCFEHFDCPDKDEPDLCGLSRCTSRIAEED